MGLEALVHDLCLRSSVPVAKAKQKSASTEMGAAISLFGALPPPPFLTFLFCFQADDPSELGCGQYKYTCPSDKKFAN